MNPRVLEDFLKRSIFSIFAVDNREDDTVFRADFLDAFGFGEGFAVKIPNDFSPRAHLVGNGFSVVRRERYRDLPRVDPHRKGGFENVFRRNEGNGAFASRSAAEDEEGSGHGLRIWEKTRNRLCRLISNFPLGNR